MDQGVRCGQGSKSASIYLISMFYSCTSEKTNSKIIKKYFLHRWKLYLHRNNIAENFIVMLYYKHNIMLITLFMNN